MTPIGERDAVRRLLQRLGFGPRRGELDTATAAGFDATLDALTAPGPDAGAAATPTPAFAAVERVPKDPASAQALQQQRTQLVVWWLDRMAAADRPFPERMTWFWHGHFATSIQKVRFANLMAIQNATPATPRHRRLPGVGAGDGGRPGDAAVARRRRQPRRQAQREPGARVHGAVHPRSGQLHRGRRARGRAGAHRLDGQRRELQRDASCPSATTRGRRRCSAGPSPTRRAWWTGSSGCRCRAAFLATRVWTRFVSDTPPDPGTLGTLAERLRTRPRRHGAGAGRRPHARVPRPRRSVLVREPVLWLTGALRALNVPASKVPAGSLAAGCAGLGQVPFAPPNVGGWPAGTPWLTTASALARLNLARAVVNVGDICPGHRRRAERPRGRDRRPARTARLHPAHGRRAGPAHR